MDHFVKNSLHQRSESDSSQLYYAIIEIELKIVNLFFCCNLDIVIEFEENEIYFEFKYFLLKSEEV